MYVFMLAMNTKLLFFSYGSRGKGQNANRRQAAGCRLPGDLFLSFFSCVSKTQPNHWTKRMASPRKVRQDPRTYFGPEDRSLALPSLWQIKSDPRQVGKTDHNVGELACIRRLTNSHNQSP